MADGIDTENEAVDEIDARYGVDDDPAGADEPTPVADRVSETLELIRPALQMDGGDISLIEVDDDNVVSVSLHGSCVGCPASLATLKAGVERILMDRVPEVREVVAVET